MLYHGPARPEECSFPAEIMHPVRKVMQPSHGRYMLFKAAGTSHTWFIKGSAADDVFGLAYWIQKLSGAGVVDAYDNSCPKCGNAHQGACPLDAPDSPCCVIS